jgi:hypothetical protein
MECSNAFLELIWRQLLAILNNIITMDESAVLFKSPETKKQLMQWVKKGQPGPIKARAHTTWFKQMVLVFFDTVGILYTKYVPKGKTVDAEYIKKSMARFLKIFRKKRLVMLPKSGSCTGTTPQSSITWWRRGSRRFATRPICKI